MGAWENLYKFCEDIKTLLQNSVGGLWGFYKRDLSISDNFKLVTDRLSIRDILEDSSVIFDKFISSVKSVTSGCLRTGNERRRGRPRRRWRDDFDTLSILANERESWKSLGETFAQQWDNIACLDKSSMESGGRSRLGRLLNKLRGDHHKFSLDKGISFTSTAMSETGTGCSPVRDFEDLSEDEEEPLTVPRASSIIDDNQFAANIDLRYGGQYLTPEQLPEFCDQLHHLVEVIRNIQSYAKVTGEYPTELERRLEREAREVSALAAETQNARDVVTRTRVQRRALQEHRTALQQQLSTLKDAEIRELESKVRLSDRKLYKNWESLKETNDSAAFEPILEEIRNKQSALECLVRLIEGRRSSITKPAVHPLPPPRPKDSEESCPSRKRADTRRKTRRRREPRSVPLSSEPSEHSHPTQVRLYIQGAEPPPPPALPALDLPSGGSVRDILFFTTNTS